MVSSWKSSTISNSESLAPIADKIIGEFFIQNIANKTLQRMKEYLEHES